MKLQTRHARPALPRLAAALAALVSTLALAQGGQITAPATEAASQRQTEAALRQAWLIDVRAGHDVRPAYTSMLASPGAGGLYFASQVEYLCAVFAQRTDPRPNIRAAYALDPNEPTYLRHQEAMRQLAVTCASITPAEGSFRSAVARDYNAVTRTSDPMLDLRHRLGHQASDRERAQTIRELLELGPSASAHLLGQAMSRWSGQNGYFVFDGVKYPLTEPQGGPLEGRSHQLLAALELASCDLGVPCGEGSLVLARNCMLRYMDCNEPDYPSVVFAQLREVGYTDLDRALIGVNRLRMRIAQAVRAKDVAAFVKKPSK